MPKTLRNAQQIELTVQEGEHWTQARIRQNWGAKRGQQPKHSDAILTAKGKQTLYKNKISKMYNDMNYKLYQLATELGWCFDYQAT
jgi:uncharacterized FlaG/YvyC family protein